MRNELINRYSHFWRIYRAVCKGFDQEPWRTNGFGVTQPNRLALHILQSTMFYLEEEESFHCPDGTVINNHAHEIESEGLPNVEAILHLSEEVEKMTELWLKNMDLNAKNEKIPWTGETQGSVALFLLSHCQYHLGEMNALLNEQLKGEAEDNFAKQLA